MLLVLIPVIRRYSGIALQLLHHIDVHTIGHFPIGDLDEGPLELRVPALGPLAQDGFCHGIFFLADYHRLMGDLLRQLAQGIE